MAVRAADGVGSVQALQLVTLLLLRTSWGQSLVAGLEDWFGGGIWNVKDDGWDVCGECV